MKCFICHRTEDLTETETTVWGGEKIKIELCRKCIAERNYLESDYV